MEIHDLHGVVNDLANQNIVKSNNNLNKIISNHKFIFIDDENKLDDTFIQQISDQNFATIGHVCNFENKYLIICFEKFLIFCLSSKIPFFLLIIHRKTKMNIISLSNSSTELLNHCINQNKITFKINITNMECIPFLKEEIRSFIHHIIINFNNKSKNMLLQSILEILTAYLLKRAYLESKMVDRIKNYCENHDENEFFILKEDDYIDLRYLSSGASSFVKLIYHIENKKLYAMKVFYKDEAFEREKLNYSKLKRYPFLCKLYGTAKDDSSNCLILEYINGFSLVEADEYLTLDEKIKIVFEMMISFNFLHKRFVIRDIHPNNFLLDSNKTLIVIDFDRMNVNTDQIYDSIDNSYLAPDDKFTVESDIYSLAKIIQFLFKNELKTEKLTKLNRMCEQCTQENPKKRPPLSQLIYELYINYFSSISNQVDETNTFKFINDITNEKYNDYLIFLSESTNQYSLNELAKIYNTDDIFNHDIYKVYKYFSSSAEQSNQDAKMNLKIILNNIKINTANIFGDIYYGSNNFQLKSNSVIDQIHNQNLQNLYKKFNFIFYPSNLDLIDFLEDIRFISYDYSETYSLGTICFEGNCIIINSNEETISNVLKNLNVSIINICQSTTNLNKNQNDLLATTEVNNFCKYFENDIELNEFVSLTIRSVATFIIRRHFYPSSFFKDASFFEFDKGIQSYEHDNKKRLYNIFKYDNDLSFKNGLRQFIHTIYKKKIHDLKTNQNNNDLANFVKSDFIILRGLYSDENSSYELAIHKNSLYIFMIHLSNENIYQEEEINFCKNNSHQCLTQFYGFIKENNKIIGFVYQYMCNGSLKNFLSNPRNETNNLFSIICIIRIFEIIYYLETKSIKNRIINISNIFLDHNNIPFIFCSNQLVQNNINIFEHFRSIIYFLYEKTELKGQDENISLNNIPPNIANLFNLCFQNDDSLMKKMAIVIFDELKYSNFFDNYIMAPIKMNKNEVINISHEMINYVVCIAQPYQLSQFILSFFFNIFSLYLQIKGDIAEIYYQRGFVYENDYGVEHDYEESKRCYEISNNPKAILHLGILYEKGYGVKKDYKKAREFYEESAKYEKKYSYYQLGHLYEKGYGVEKDFSKAKEYFLISCLNNHENYFHLGYMYEKGNDFIKDYTKAKEYYKMAAQYEDSNAFTHLGIMYLKGMGVSKNYKLAINYLKRAAKLKNSDTLYYLGRIYEKGIGVKQNDEISIHYYEISSKSKNSLALLRLVKLLYDKN